MKIFENIKTTKRMIEIHLNSAKERLKSAETLYKEELYRDAVSRSYYAFLDAARAALLTKKRLAKTHAGTLTLFGMHFVKTKKIPLKFINFYKRVKDSREEADYELLRKFEKKDAKKAIEMAKEFVAEVEKMLKG